MPGLPRMRRGRCIPWTETHCFWPLGHACCQQGGATAPVNLPAVSSARAFTPGGARAACCAAAACGALLRISVRMCATVTCWWRSLSMVLGAAGQVRGRSVPGPGWAGVTRAFNAGAGGRGHQVARPAGQTNSTSELIVQRLLEAVPRPQRTASRARSSSLPRLAPGPGRGQTCTSRTISTRLDTQVSGRDRGNCVLWGPARAWSLRRLARGLCIDCSPPERCGLPCCDLRGGVGAAPSRAPARTALVARRMWYC